MTPRVPTFIIKKFIRRGVIFDIHVGMAYLSSFLDPQSDIIYDLLYQSGGFEKFF